MQKLWNIHYIPLWCAGYQWVPFRFSSVKLQNIMGPTVSHKCQFWFMQLSYHFKSQLYLTFSALVPLNITNSDGQNQSFPWGTVNTSLFNTFSRIFKWLLNGLNAYWKPTPYQQTNHRLAFLTNGVHSDVVTGPEPACRKCKIEIK